MNKPRTVESPTTLLHNAMNSSARLSQHVRRALQREVKQIERELRSPGLQPGRRLELMDSLLTTMSALDRSAEQCGRLLTQKHNPAIPTDDPSVERVMEELTRGQARGAGR